ncbi:MAG TPA: HAD hydrolase-like protein, partial [Myxococcaceae bacterium]|nr:HAD hydrolase-like protein [Myxococcaceae bacterium]
LVGDTVYDLRCALNAGLTPVGVTWGFRSREQLEALDLSGVQLFDDVEALQRFLTRPTEDRPALR